jgi:hypothetical protein
MEESTVGERSKVTEEDNFTINSVNLFRGENYKIKLKEANSFSGHVRLYKPWISEQQKKGRVFKYRSHSPLPWDIHPKINWNKSNVDSILHLSTK